MHMTDGITADKVIKDIWTEESLIETHQEFTRRTEFTELFDVDTRGGLLQPSGDARKARGLKIPHGPTPQEREEHELDCPMKTLSFKGLIHLQISTVVGMKGFYAQRSTV